MNKHLLYSALIVLVLMGGVLWYSYEPESELGKLKTTKEKILSEKIVKDKDGKDIVEYFYKTDKKVRDERGEIKSKRTKSIKFFKAEDLGGSAEEILCAVPCAARGRHGTHQGHTGAQPGSHRPYVSHLQQLPARGQMEPQR